MVSVHGRCDCQDEVQDSSPRGRSPPPGGDLSAQATCVSSCSRLNHGQKSFKSEYIWLCAVRSAPHAPPPPVVFPPCSTSSSTTTTAVTLKLVISFCRIPLLLNYNSSFHNNRHHITGGGRGDIIGGHSGGATMSMGG